MRIIVQGDLNRLKKPVLFYCKECGCSFEANKDEYKIEFQYNEGYEYYKIQCPCCNHWVFLDR